jgi:hypothetical protein
MPPKNPWTNISWKNTIADCDKTAVRKYLVGFGRCTAKRQIHNEMLPEPFIGDLGANVYLLNGNPGFSTSDLLLVNDSTFEKQIQDTLNQVSRSFMWLQKSTSVIYKDLHSGYNWWNRVMKEVLKKKAHPRICNIEYYPYHSCSIPAGLPYLPSNAYVDCYINDAIAKGKWIIVLRCRDEWLARIPKLNGYSKLLFCCSRRNVRVSQNNLCDAKNIKINNSIWNTLINAM